MVRVISLPYSVADHVRLVTVPNYLKEKVDKDDVLIIMSVTIYYGNKGVSPIYRVFDLNNNNYFVVHGDYLGDI